MSGSISIPAPFIPQPIDYGKGLSNLNAFRELQSQQAEQDASKNALLPDGSGVDPAKYNRLLANDPRSYNTVKAMGQLGQATNAQANAATTQTNLQLHRVGTMVGALTPLLQREGPISRQDVADTLTSTAQSMGWSPTEVQGIVTQLNSLPPGADLKEFVRGRMTMLTNAQEQLERSTPKWQFHDTGGGFAVWDQNNPNSRPAGMTRAPGGGSTIDRTVGPEYAATPRTTTDPGTQQPVTAPAAATTDPRLLSPNQRPQPGGPNNPMGTGRYPTPQGQGGGGGPNQPPAATPGGPLQPSATPPPAPPVPAGAEIPGAGGKPIVGANPYQLEGNKQDVDQYNADIKAVPDLIQSNNTLDRAREALRGTITGKGAAPLQSLLAVINTISPSMAGRIAAADETKRYDMANKYLIDNWRTSGAATRSDAAQAAAQGANPSVDISNEAAMDVANYRRGVNSQQIAARLLHKDTTGIGYRAHLNQFLRNTDPRGFAWDGYTDQEQAALKEQVANDPAAKRRLALSITMGRKLANGELQ